jgi:hypothetical protein
MKHIARVYLGSGIVAVQGKNPKPVAGTVDIDIAIPEDFDVSYKPYFWDFNSSSWAIDQDKLDKKAAKKAKKVKKFDDEVNIHSEAKDLLDDITTDWTDPNGDILKLVVEQIKKLTVDLR